MLVAMIAGVVVGAVPETYYTDFKPRQPVPGTACTLELENETESPKRPPPFRRVTLTCARAAPVVLWVGPLEEDGQEVENMRWVWTGDVDRDGRVDVQLAWDNGKGGSLLFLSGRAGKPLLRNQEVSDALAQRDRALLLKQRLPVSVEMARQLHVRITRCFARPRGCWGPLLSTTFTFNPDSSVPVPDVCLDRGSILATLDTTVQRSPSAACPDNDAPYIRGLLKELTAPGAAHREDFVNRVLHGAETMEGGVLTVHGDQTASELKLRIQNRQLIIERLVGIEGC